MIAYYLRVLQDGRVLTKQLSEPRSNAQYKLITPDFCVGLQFQGPNKAIEKWPNFLVENFKINGTSQLPANVIQSLIERTGGFFCEDLVCGYERNSMIRLKYLDQLRSISKPDGFFSTQVDPNTLVADSRRIFALLVKRLVEMRAFSLEMQCLVAECLRLLATGEDGLRLLFIMGLLTEVGDVDSAERLHLLCTKCSDVEHEGSCWTSENMVCNECGKEHYSEQCDKLESLEEGLEAYVARLRKLRQGARFGRRSTRESKPSKPIDQKRVNLALLNNQQLWEFYRLKKDTWDLLDMSKSGTTECQRVMEAFVCRIGRTAHSNRHKRMLAILKLFLDASHIDYAAAHARVEEEVQGLGISFEQANKTQYSRLQAKWLSGAPRTYLTQIPALFDDGYLTTLGIRDTSVDYEQKEAKPALARTTNEASGFSESGSYLLDLFLGSSNASTRSELHEKIALAWNENPLLSLKIIWNLRSISDGKSDKWRFMWALLWLYEHCPRTLMINLHLIVKEVCVARRSRKRSVGARLSSHGCFKDLLSFLGIVTGTDAEINKALHSSDTRFLPIGGEISDHVNKLMRTDSTYQALHITIARIFATEVQADMHTRSKTSNLSFAAKWAPSINLSFDKSTLVTTSIARLLFRDHPLVLECSNVEDSDDLARSLYCREISRLRGKGFIPERHMKQDDWRMEYNKVPATCFKLNELAFFRHDEAGLSTYIESLKEGATIAAKTLKPAEIVSKCCITEVKVGRRGASIDVEKFTAYQSKLWEVRWISLLNYLRVQGKIEDTVPVCDVSGSMGSINDARSPMANAVALSLLLCEMNPDSPYYSRFITFSQNPSWVSVPQETSLRHKVNQMTRSDWGMNTNLNATFTKLLIPHAVKHQVKLPGRIVVFSDMQFDTAQRGDWTTEYRLLRAAVENAQLTMPEIVFWNLAQHNSNPSMAADADQPGVSMMSGSSPMQIKIFLGLAPEQQKTTETEMDQRRTPYETMLLTLEKPCFSELAVAD